MIYHALLLAPAVCLLAQEPPPQQAPAVPPDKVVISVGGTSFTAAQFSQLMEMLPEANRAAAQTPAGRRQFADEIVRVLVLADEGKRRKLDETSAYKTQTQFQSQNLLAGKAFQALTKPNDAELRAYYEAHQGDFEEVHARHILIRAKGSPVPADPGQKELTEDEALAKAQDLRKKIVEGADFSLLARTESDDSSKQAGGDLNFFHRGQLVPPFEQAAFALKVGEVSEPVKTPFGYHLIKVEGKKTESFEEAKPEIEKKLQPQKGQGVVEDLVKKAMVNLDSDFFGTEPAAAPQTAPAKK